MSEAEGPPSTSSAVFGPGGARIPGKALKAVSVHEDSFSRQSGFEATDAVIMMVDDEILNIEMTQAFLEDAGWRHFISTHESEHAVAMMRSQRPHVLLLDLSMPKVSGLEILEALQMEPELRHVPVIVLTSSTDSPTKLRALGLGAMDFLAKPVDPSELALRLRNTLAATAHREFLAHHDGLTGLRNRLRYIQDAQAALAKAGQQKHSCAVLHIGVDRLSQVNDALGRAAGDAVLQRMARRLRHCVETEQGGDFFSPDDNEQPHLYRFDGDEFAVLLPRLEEAEQIASIIGGLMEAASASFKAADREVFVTASMGVAVFPGDAANADELIQNAGLAMRHAKQSGRNTYEFFSSSLNQRAVQTLQVGGDLRRALGRNEVSLLYQPRIDVRTGELKGAETVLRWQRPNGQVVEGNEVLQMAQTSEMSMVLAEWLLEEIAAQTKAWQAGDVPVVPLGVNLSLRQFPLPQLQEILKVALKGGAQARLMCLELNDVSALDDLSAAAGMIGKFKEWGLRVSLDHFGMPDAGLSHLASLPVDEIKVDPSFMARIEESKANAAIMLALIPMARAMGVTLVATGIQSLQQLAFLKNNGVDQCQGRLFNNPMAAAEFEAKWLRRSAGKPG